MGKKNGIAAQILLKDSMYFIELAMCQVCARRWGNPKNYKELP